MDTELEPAARCTGRVLVLLAPWLYYSVQSNYEPSRATRVSVNTLRVTLLFSF